jgi:hypothetical protein
MFERLANAAGSAATLRSALRTYSTRLARENEEDRREEVMELRAASDDDDATGGAGSPGLKFHGRRSAGRVRVQLTVLDCNAVADSLRQPIIFAANFARAAAALLRACGGAVDPTEGPSPHLRSRTSSRLSSGATTPVMLSLTPPGPANADVHLTSASAYSSLGDVPWDRLDALLDTMRVDARGMSARVQKQRRALGKLVEATEKSRHLQLQHGASSTRHGMDSSSLHSTAAADAFASALHRTVGSLEKEYRESLSRLRFAEMCVSIFTELYREARCGDAACLPPDYILKPLLLDVITHHLAREGHDDADERAWFRVDVNHPDHKYHLHAVEFARAVADEHRGAVTRDEAQWLFGGAPIMLVALPPAALRVDLTSPAAYDVLAELYYDQNRLNELQRVATVDMLLRSDRPNGLWSAQASVRKSNDADHPIFLLTRRQPLRLDTGHPATARLLAELRECNKVAANAAAAAAGGAGGRKDPLAATQRPLDDSLASRTAFRYSKLQAGGDTAPAPPPPPIGDLLKTIESSLNEALEFASLTAAAGVQLLSAEQSLRSAAELAQQSQHNASGIDGLSPIRAPLAIFGGDDEADEAINVLRRELITNETILASRQSALDVLQRELEGLRSVVATLPMNFPASVLLRAGGATGLQRRRLLSQAMREHTALSVELAAYMANTHHRMDLATRRSGILTEVELGDGDDEAALLRGDVAVDDYLHTNPSVAAAHGRRATRGPERRALDNDVSTFVKAHERLGVSVYQLSVNLDSTPIVGPPRSGAATPMRSASVPAETQTMDQPATGSRPATPPAPQQHRFGQKDPVDATLHQLRGVGLIVYYDPNMQPGGRPAAPNAAAGAATRRRAATFTAMGDRTSAGLRDADDFYSRCFAMRLSAAEDALELYDSSNAKAPAPTTRQLPRYTFALSDIESVSQPYPAPVSLKTAVAVEVRLRSRNAAVAVFVFPSAVSQAGWLAAMARLARNRSTLTPAARHAEL